MREVVLFELTKNGSIQMYKENKSQREEIGLVMKSREQEVLKKRERFMSRQIWKTQMLERWEWSLVETHVGI